jgi:hypothetical protein
LRGIYGTAEAVPLHNAGRKELFSASCEVVAPSQNKSIRALFAGCKSVPFQNSEGIVHFSSSSGAVRLLQGIACNALTPKMVNAGDS